MFDSGIGGEAVAKTLADEFPKAEIVTVNDRNNVPYGDKTDQEIIKLTNQAIQPLLNSSCDIIVIACNTATTIAINHLRSTYPKQQFIGLEPMVKPASQQTKSGIIGVCATPATLRSANYQLLKDAYAKNVEIIEPDCSDWARMIEENSLNDQVIDSTVEYLCASGADVIVLACTHYHWIKDRIEKNVDGRASVIEPSLAIAKRIRHLLNIS